MIITCPTCLRRYEVSSKVIGEGRMVRCIVCGTTWQQDAEASRTSKGTKSFFWRWIFSLLIFSSISSYFYFYVPVVSDFPKYKSIIREAFGCEVTRPKIVNISHKLEKRDDGLYVTFQGEVADLSEVAPGKDLNLVFNLKSQKKDAKYAEGEGFFNETWTQKVAFPKKGKKVK